jgi:Zn-dependent M28 family amino/carboxypeptidase
MTQMLSSCSGTLAGGQSIDGEAALEHVKQLVSWGPHPPGSEAQMKVGDYLVATLKNFDLQTHEHRLDALTPMGRIEMRNIWAEVKGATDSVIVLASHYDSKYFEDIEFVGANDGGSSTGVLLELARELSENNPTPFTLWFVFFDGEEAFRTWTQRDSLYGSRAFVKWLRAQGKLSEISALILLDMVGSKDLALTRDRNSTQWLNDLIWRRAAEMGHSDVFAPSGWTAAVDDHIPFSEQGIPVVDLIDLRYPHWHTSGDTIDKLSPIKMEIVGNVVLGSLPEIAAELQNRQGR